MKTFALLVCIRFVSVCIPGSYIYLERYSVPFFLQWNFIHDRILGSFILRTSVLKQEGISGEHADWVNLKKKKLLVYMQWLCAHIRTKLFHNSPLTYVTQWWLASYLAKRIQNIWSLLRKARPCLMEFYTRTKQTKLNCPQRVDSIIVVPGWKYVHLSL